MLPSFFFFFFLSRLAISAWDVLLKLDISHICKTKSWTELHEGAAIWIFGRATKPVIKSCGTVDRQKLFFSSFFSLHDVRNDWISAEQLCVPRGRTEKVAAFKKIQLAWSLLHWRVRCGGGEPGSQPVKFCFYTQYCWILSVAFGLLRSYCLTCYCFFFIIHLLVCRIHDHWHHIVSKNPRWVMLFFKCKPVPKNYLFFFFGFVLFFVVFFFCSFCIVDNKIISPDVLDFYYMTTFCKHWSNHNI